MEIPGGGGGSNVKPTGTENPGGRGLKLEKTLHGGGGMDIFWNHTFRMVTCQSKQNDSCSLEPAFDSN